MLLIALVGLTVIAPTASRAASASFQGLGFLSGYSNSRATGVSADGSAVVGNTCTSTACQAFRWSTASGMVGLGFLSSDSSATGVSADGSVVVGNSGNQPFRWTAAGGFVNLGSPTGSAGSLAYGVSGDSFTTSTVVAGSSGVKAYRWTADGWVLLGSGYLSGYCLGSSSGISADGSVVAGYSQACGVAGGSNCDQKCQAFRWTAAGGMVGLGYLSGYSSSSAFGVSGDGSVVVGYSCCTDTGGKRAFRWTAADGMKSIQDLLTAAGVSFTGWVLQYATGVSKDGTTIVGYGIDPSGNTQAWIARLPLAPGSLSVTPSSPLNFHGSAGGPFTSDLSGQFTLTNTGMLSLNYAISLPNWLTVSPSSSGSLAGGGSASIVVLPGPSAIGAGAGNYSSSIVFNNTTNGSGNASVVANLLVNQPPGRLIGSNDNGRTSPPPDEVAGINRPALPLPLR